ncbi:heavy-metal-associated domain-containing protein [Nodosilinea sp. LEGE 07088]|uniref:heavy-metal-associated domain-containing protein n=1 Tax=Nodosilinea sp. LEGE 07088 TaxID=2777968 RepID=UPI001881565D|nr:heavy-metal-associated domain-containing protein [Nodosilinea sp. LEGE 07088]MBE9141485.1 heavy-metal-associated domain-containing protein [Nodosilinea sp. LEGE 07088]
MTLNLTVPDLACSACVDTVTKAIQAIDATAQVNADPKTKQVSVDTTASEVAVKTAITTAGYTIA